MNETTKTMAQMKCKPEFQECEQDAVWLLIDSQIHQDTYACHEHVSALIADTTIEIVRTNENAQCCWLIGQSRPEKIERLAHSLVNCIKHGEQYNTEYADIFSALCEILEIGKADVQA